MRTQDAYGLVSRAPTARLQGRELLGMPALGAGIALLAVPATMAAAFLAPAAPVFLAPAVPVLAAFGGAALGAGFLQTSTRVTRWLRERAQPIPIASAVDGWVTIRGRVALAGHRVGTVVAHADALRQASARIEIVDDTGTAIVDDDLLVLPDPPLDGRFELKVGDLVSVSGPAHHELREVAGADYRATSTVRVLVFDGHPGAPVRICRS